MAEKKITLVSLRKMLAKQTGVSESKAGKFLDLLFPAIVNGLKEDGQVRINGFGTFKLLSVKPRRSINIKTGESFIIEGYNKVVLTPEPVIQKQANAPLAHLQSITLEGNATPPVFTDTDPLKKLGEQAEEIKDILAELGTDVTETPETTPTTEEPAITETPKEQEETTTVETPKEQVTTETPIAEPKPKKAEGDFHPWKVAGITIMLFCILLIGAYFFLRHKLTSWAESLTNQGNNTENVVKPQSKPLEIEVITPNTENTTVESNAIEATEAETTDEPKNKTGNMVSQPSEEQKWYGTEREYTKFIKTETLGEGSRLTHLSRKYYGAPDFWVYIYEANKDKIKNPNVIGQGTKLRIPDLPKELTDTNNPKAMRQAKELHEKILGSE